MSVLYSVRQSTIANKEGKKLFHPQVKTTGNVSLDTLADEVAELSSLSPGDVKNATDNLVTVMTRHLQSGESVTIGDLGTFYFVMKSIGKGFETAEEVNANNCRVKVMFRPASTRNPDRTVATRTLVTGVTFKRADSLFPGSGSTGSGGSGSSSGGSDGNGDDLPTYD